VIREYIKKVSNGEHLTAEEAEEAMSLIMLGQATDAQTGAFLTALKIKNETPEEIAAFAKVMRRHSVKINPEVEGTLVDVCGTGGDSKNTFNVSTTSMFVVAAGGVPVAKHGNRCLTSHCGSADVLEALGARIDLPPERIERSIEEVGVGFMFAPAHHPAMKHVMPARKQIGIRTVFNILGPLTNPANANAQLMGVFDPELTEKIAEVFRQLGLERAMVVHGEPGLDEVSNLGRTRISELNDNAVKSYTITAEDFGVSRAKLSEISGGSPQENAVTLRNILSGREKGPRRDIVLLNAAAGLIVGGKAKYFSDGIELAEGIVDSGKATKKLEEYVEHSK
jgi:anthranilate phosphoribosyltransferase